MDVDPRVAQLASKIKVETAFDSFGKPKEWTIKSIKAMNRVLKKYNAEEHMFNLISLESSHSRCCVINNEKMGKNYGRIQLFILKLYRFPWIRYNTQIKSNRHCRNPFNRLDKNLPTCVNPFHYDAVQVPTKKLQPIVINKQHDFGVFPTDLQDSSHNALMRLSKGENHSGDQEYDEESGVEPGSTESPDSDCYDKQVPNIVMEGDDLMTLFENLAREEEQKQRNNTSLGWMSPTSPPLFFNRHNIQRDDVLFRSGLSSPASISGAPFFSNDIEMADYDDYGSKNIVDYWPEYRSGVGKLASVANGQFECVEFEEPHNWLSLTCYEGSRAISSPIDISSSHVLIDGYTSSTLKPNRISLGYFSNVHRTAASTDVRQQIGEGVRMYYLGGEVFIQSETNLPVFVQSICSNLERNLHINTVSKIGPFCSIKAFSNALFAGYLADAAEKSYEDVYALLKLCTIRLSFVKGWGVCYKRASVLSSPCWVQSQLNGPQKWIEKVLECMGASPFSCSSRT